MSNSNSIQITKASIMANFELVASPMKLMLVVVSAPSKWVNPRLKNGKRGATYSHSYIINFKAIDSRKVPSMMAQFEKSGGESMDIENFKFGLTREVIVHHGAVEPALPMKGEAVECDLQYATNADGMVLDINKKPVLEVAAFKIKAAQTTSGVSWDTFTTGDRKSISAPDATAEAEEVDADGVLVEASADANAEEEKF